MVAQVEVIVLPGAGRGVARGFCSTAWTGIKHAVACLGFELWTAHPLDILGGAGVGEGLARSTGDCEEPHSAAICIG